MWRKALVAGTIAASLIAATSLAGASTGGHEVSVPVDGTGEQHGSMMGDQFGADWSGMESHMDDVTNGSFADMEGMMERLEFGMGDGQDSGFMDGYDMGSLEMGGTGPDGFMDWFPFMADGDDVGGFMGGYDMGSLEMGGMNH